MPLSRSNRSLCGPYRRWLVSACIFLIADLGSDALQTGDEMASDIIGGTWTFVGRDRTTSAAVTVLLRGRSGDEADEADPDSNASDGCSGLDRGANAAACDAVGLGLDCESENGARSACVPHCITEASSSCVVIKPTADDDGEVNDARELDDSHAPGWV